MCYRSHWIANEQSQCCLFQAKDLCSIVPVTLRNCKQPKPCSDYGGHYYCHLSLCSHPLIPNKRVQRSLPMARTYVLIAMHGVTYLLATWCKVRGIKNRMRWLFGIYLCVNAYFALCFGIGILLSGLLEFLGGSQDAQVGPPIGYMFSGIGLSLILTGALLRKWGHNLRFD